MTYKPPAGNKIYDDDLETLHDVVTPWMRPPLMRWLAPMIEVTNDMGETFPNDEFIEGLQMNLRMLEPLDRRSPVRDLESLIEFDPAFGIKVIEYVIGTWFVIEDPENSHYINSHQRDPVDRILDQSGSAWQVTTLDVPGGHQGQKRLVLTRRDLAEAKLAITDIREQTDRPGSLLADAWKAIATQDPRPTEAYLKAVMAIEVAAQPIVLPKNPKATLGLIISAMNDKPSKWNFALGDLSPVIETMDQIWTNHFRHGTQERDDHTPQEADAAVHLAVPLVRLFVGGIITVA